MALAQLIFFPFSFISEKNSDESVYLCLSVSTPVLKSFWCQALCYGWGYYEKQDRVDVRVPMALQAVFAPLPFDLQLVVIMTLLQPFHWTIFALDLLFSWSLSKQVNFFGICLLIYLSCTLRYWSFFLFFSTSGICNIKLILFCFWLLVSFMGSSFSIHNLQSCSLACFRFLIFPSFSFYGFND